MKQVSKCQARTTDEQIATADKFLKAFGMDAIYKVTSPLPDRAGAVRLGSS
jgi:hypothetical protein